MRRYKHLLFFCMSILIAKVLNAQTSIDSLIILQYRYDTTGFVSFPTTKVIDAIQPAKGYKQWELNTWTRNGYQCLQRVPATTQPASEVLSKPQTGFGTICPPSGCFWYFSAKKKEEVYTIGDPNSLKNFLGSIDTPYDAYVWLVGNWQGTSTFVPSATNGVTYKKVRDGYLLSFYSRISDCPITSANLIYFIGKKHQVVKVGMSNITSSNSCI